MIIAWSIKHDQKFRKSKKIDFWGSDLIDDRLIEKKIDSTRNQNPELLERKASLTLPYMT